jgi:hypothetical protein
VTDRTRLGRRRPVLLELFPAGEEAFEDLVARQGRMLTALNERIAGLQEVMAGLLAVTRPLTSTSAGRVSE